MAEVRKKKKIPREYREALDNKVVLATSIALIGTIFLMYLYRWQLAYPIGTRNVILALMWTCVAGVAFTVLMYFIKKKKAWLVGTAYCAVAAFIFTLIAYNFLALLGIPTSSVINYSISYIIIGVYLIASFISYFVAIKNYK